MSEVRYNIAKDTIFVPGLYIVSTPIGNLRDITLRALDILSAADIIACEDTRVSLKLFNYYNIKAKLISYHEHNSASASKKILNYLEQGKIVALISDAGTPLLSDPGYNLVRYARENNFEVFPIPGACAAIAALVGAGLSLDEFYFSGFLPTKTKQRQDKLKNLNYQKATLIFYESPNRLLKSLKDMCLIFGENRKAAICRELTKKFETYDIATLQELYDKYSNIEHKIGEIVILVEPNNEPIQNSYSTEEILKLAETYKELPLAKIALAVSKITGEQKSYIYKILLQRKNEKN